MRRRLRSSRLSRRLKRFTLPIKYIKDDRSFYLKNKGVKSTKSENFTL